MVRHHAICPVLLLLIITLVNVGCQSYTAPGASADLTMFQPPEGMSEQELSDATDAEIAERLRREPLASFPVNLAVARVQADGYRSRTVKSHGRGAYSVVSTRDVESEAAFADLESLPQVQGVSALPRLVVPNELHSDEQLRTAAASLRANMLLIYTFDTHIHIGDSDSPVDVVTLGFLPNKQARVETTASAVLMDTRNGYIYGTAEGAGRTTQRANTWTESEAVDQSRRRAEAEAFEKLLDAFADTWTGVLAEYHAPTARIRAPR